MAHASAFRFLFFKREGMLMKILSEPIRITLFFYLSMALTPADVKAPLAGGSPDSIGDFCRCALPPQGLVPSPLPLGQHVTFKTQLMIV